MGFEENKSREGSTGGQKMVVVERKKKHTGVGRLLS